MTLPTMLLYVTVLIASLHASNLTSYPPSPTFSVSPSSNLYKKGQKVTMMCSPPNNSDVMEIIFYKDNKLIHTNEQQGAKNNTMMSLSNKEDEGNYHCGYTVNNNGTPKLSITSNTVFIRMSGYPPSPTFSVSPSSNLYNKGQKVTMMCSPPNNSDVMEIIFYKDNKLIHTNEQQGAKNNTMMSLSNKEDEGNYHCGYTVNNNGTPKLSITSNTVFIRMSDSIPYWSYYMAGGSLFLSASAAVAFLLFRRAQKKKAENLVSTSHVKEDDLYSEITLHPFLENEKHSSTEVPKRINANSKDHAAKSFKTFPPLDLLSPPDKEIEVLHTYSEIDHYTSGKKSALLTDSYITIYSTAQALDPLPFVYQTVVKKTT
ncbi:uncharacterized protein LOC134897660 [Pseudophryne corroboree]|uniref:uncharacterized protein LOC134897660 n=1 Tax=Pseudophryne corroboree TaxID=495146 RepID=UPI0030820661